MNDLTDITASYERQLAHLKRIIPQLGCPQQVQLCSVWVERFTSCTTDEEIYRSKLVNLFVRQLRESGRLSDPFLSDRNALKHLRMVFQDHVDCLVKKKTEHCYDESDAEEETCVKMKQALTRFEHHLGQIETSDRPYENLQRLQFLEYLDIDDSFHPILERIQQRWNGIFNNMLRNQSQPTTTAKSCTSSSSSASSTSSENIGPSCGIICSDPRHISTNCLAESPSKYKTFALKCAKRIEKMQQEIAKLKQNAQIQASTECIRFAALKSELVQRTGAKQQAEMCAMIDQLDERYREIIAKSMALGVAETKRGKAT